MAAVTAGGALPAFSADGQALLIAGMDETIQIWPLTVDNDGLARCHRSHTLCRNSGRTVAFAVNPQGANLATGAYDGDVYLWDAHSGARLHRLQGHAGWITRVSYATDGQTLASAATDGTIRIWRVCDGACLQILTVPGPFAGMTITHSRGLTATQRASLKALGAITDESAER